ncbi:MAG TPA: serine/threonine-protein kinase, partial [Nannocystaceae bacterium]|nr:serine/threonine-protein kinase [Nannocystaceae bacterium]
MDDSPANDEVDHGDMQVARLLCGFVVQCLGSETIALYVIGALEPEPRARADAHADRCPACRRLIAELARASADGGGDAIDTSSSPRVHGRYRLREVLGAGAMGIVWRAHDPELGREVAIKILRGRSNGPSLLDEARAMAAVEDPNVVRVYDVGSLDGQVYVAMELVRGGTLRGWHATTRPSWSELAAVMRQAALGLVAVHAAGLVHRDFKPENVLIAPGDRVLVADFGLATALVHDDTDEPGEREVSVRTPMLVGTPAYMAPELLAGGAPSPAGDQFAWCVTFCELLAGRRTHTRAITLPNGLPRRLARVLARGLRADPEQRWPSMTALVRALDRVLDPPRVGAWALGLGALVAIAGAGYGFERAPAASCDLPTRAPVLDDARRQAIGASLERVRPTMPPAVAAVVDRLERWIPAWAEQAQQACETRASDPQRFAT